MIEAADTPVGYLGIKDTRADLWDLAIELDGQQTHRGYGSRSIRLFPQRGQPDHREAGIPSHCGIR